MLSKHQVGKQLKLFPTTICSAYCPWCGMITVHYWGKDHPEDHLALICNECGDADLDLGKHKH